MYTLSCAVTIGFYVVRMAFIVIVLLFRLVVDSVYVWPMSDVCCVCIKGSISNKLSGFYCVRMTTESERFGKFTANYT